MGTESQTDEAAHGNGNLPDIVLENAGRDASNKSGGRVLRAPDRGRSGSIRSMVPPRVRAVIALNGDPDLLQEGSA
jgi:hypothetical protein